MKTILETLILIKTQLTYMSNRGDDVLGLCAACEELIYREEISRREQEQFHKFYIRSKRGQKWFYEYSGFKTLERNQFGWKISDFNSRLAWLDRNINRLQKS